MAAPELSRNSAHPKAASAADGDMVALALVDLEGALP